MNPPLAQLLDSSAGARDVKELPLWIVKPLVTHGHCKTSTPKIFSKKTLSKLKANASHQLLYNLSPYFYEVGCEVTELLGDVEINTAVTAAYVQRYKDILDRFGHMEDKGAGKFKGCLTLFEQKCELTLIVDAMKINLAYPNMCCLQYTISEILWLTTTEHGEPGNLKQSSHRTLRMLASGLGSDLFKNEYITSTIARTKSFSTT